MNRRKKSSTLKRIIISIAVIIAAIVMLILTLNHTSKSKVDSALKKIRDAGEPTTIAGMFSPEIPDDQNAAIPFESVSILLEDHKDDLLLINRRKLKRPVEDLCKDPANTEKRAAVVTTLREAIDKSDEIYQYLDRATALRKCRFDIVYAGDNPFTMLLPHLSDLRNCARLMHAKAVYLAATGKPDQAFDTIRQMLIMSGYLKDDPVLISSLVRISIQAIAINTLEKTLAISSPSP